MTTTVITDGVTLSAASWGNDVDAAAYSILSSVSGTNTITATGSANYTYAATRNPIWFIPAVTNTAATTLNVTPSGSSALGAKNIFRNGLALIGGELKAGVPAGVIYDGTQFQIVGNGTAISSTDIAVFISGLTYSNSVADATNDIDIAAGRCVDSTGVDVIKLAAITKQLDAAWAVGTNAGGLDTGSIGNSDYYIWAIKRPDTQVTDALFSLSSTAPTMPTNYTLKRLIGWFKRVGGTIVAFHTYETEGGGVELQWDVPTLDVNLSNTLTTARRTDAVKVPLNFSTLSHVNVLIDDGGAQQTSWVYCPDQTDAAPSTTAAPLSNIPQATAAMRYSVTELWVRTSATGTIAARSLVATCDLYAVATMGFRWARRN